MPFQCSTHDLRERRNQPSPPREGGFPRPVLDEAVPFSGDTLHVIAELKKIYGCTLTAADSHQLSEPTGPE